MKIGFLFNIRRRTHLGSRSSDKLHNITFIIEGDSSTIMNVILRSLLVFYGSVY